MKERAEHQGPGSARNVVLFLCHRLESPHLRFYRKLEQQLKGHAELLWLFHADQQGDRRPPVPHWTFTLGELTDAGYHFLWPGTILGSTDLPLLHYAMQTMGEWDYLWLIEHDVRYSGNWGDFLNYFKHNQADLITSNIRNYEDEPNWIYWDLHHPTKEIPLEERVSSLNTIYRIGAEACQLLSAANRGGWLGHHEVCLPTLVKHAGLKVEDFGGYRSYTPPSRINYFYTPARSNSFAGLLEGTNRARAPFIVCGWRPHTIYHPVKTVPENLEWFFRRVFKLITLGWLREQPKRPVRRS